MFTQGAPRVSWASVFVSFCTGIRAENRKIQEEAFDPSCCGVYSQQPPSPPPPSEPSVRTRRPAAFPLSQAPRAILMPNSFLNERQDNSITNTSSTLRPTVRSTENVVGSAHKDNHSGFTADDQWLPPPVIAKQYGIECRVRKQTKFRQSRLRVHWDNFTRKLGNGTAPSTSSILDGSTVDGSHRMHEPRPEHPDDEVDEVVVDRAWFKEQKNPSTESEPLTPVEKYADNPTGGTNTDRESLAVVEGFWAKSALLIFLRWRVWPTLLGFFRLRFIDEKSEAHYSKESWFFRKTLALFCSLFFVGNWILGVAFLPQPASLSDKIFYYGVRNACPAR